MATLDILAIARTLTDAGAALLHEPTATGVAIRTGR